MDNVQKHSTCKRRSSRDATSNKSNLLGKLVYPESRDKSCHLQEYYIITQTIAHSTEQSASSEAAGNCVSQDIPSDFMDTNGLLSCSQDPASRSYHNPDESNTHSRTSFLQDPS
jgi:hypothetical protein